MNIEAAQIPESGISNANIDFYKEYGFLIASGLLSDESIANLKIEARHIFTGKRGMVDGLVEAEENESEIDVLKRYIAIHFPHKISPMIKEYLAEEKIVNILTKIVGPNVKCIQSMLFVKPPGKEGQSWHQDEYYIPTRDKSLTGVWIAMDDATIENGCLWIIPGSNKDGYIMQRTPNTNKEYADLETIDVSHYPKEDSIPVEVKSGSVIFFNGYTLHSSLKNKTKTHFRMALVNHYMNAESMLPWDQDGKFPLTEDLRDIVLVAGFDPYSYKGVVDINKSYLRPDVLERRNK